MVRVRKNNIHTGNTKFQGSRPRQFSGNVQTSSGHIDKKKRGSSPNRGRQGPVLRGSVSNKKGKRQEKKTLANGYFGELPDAGNAQNIAKFYYESHGLVVIPCVRGEKFPPGEWKHLNEQVVWDTESVLNQWRETIKQEPISEEISDHNYATLCGPSGVTVIDFDDKEVADKFPVDTLTIETPNGRHFYIRIEDGEVSNSTFPKYHVDIRGNGGIAILPPSLGADARPYKLSSNQQIIKWTLETFHSYMRSITGNNGSELDGLLRTSNEQGWFVDLFGAGANKGSRNNDCTKLAGYLLAANLTVEDVTAILVLWSDKNCSPPLPPEEVIRCVESIARREERNENKEAGEFERDLASAKTDPNNPFVDS